MLLSSLPELRARKAGEMAKRLKAEGKRLCAALSGWRHRVQRRNM